MSLPASQQRVLNGIAEALRVSEPRLASMFSIFTRLCKNEGPPWREQLTASTGLPARAAGLRRPLARQRTSRGRRTWRRMLIVSQLAIAFVLLCVLVGMNSRAPAGCGRTAFARASVVSVSRGQACQAQAGLARAMLGK